MRNVDVLILGSGFGGSLLALILATRGRSVVLIDKHRHPRFAIGESSTPLADSTLARIADHWQLPRLKPLTEYGSWKRTYPDLTCGLKRGFTYLAETASAGGRSETGDPAIAAARLPRPRRMLVAASSSDEHSDTQWLRSDIDAFLFREAVAAGATAVEECRYDLARAGTGWSFSVTDAAGRRLDGTADFVVDATGGSRALLRILGVGDRTHELATHSRAIYAHFAGVERCETLLRASGEDVQAFPFRCDDAAVHVLRDNGWMWQLRFDDDTVSVGLVTDCRPQAAAGESVARDWEACLAESPFLNRQFRAARIVRPEHGLVRTDRLQRLAAAAAGPGWAVLPHTAGFIDPLHSTGIAHTLTGVERLAAILTAAGRTAEREERLAEFGRDVLDELRLIDELVAGCYAALPDFDLFCDWSMLYFAAATAAEQGSGSDANPDRPVAGGFLQVRDAAFRNLIRSAHRELTAAVTHRSPDASRGFRSWLRTAIAPWNQVGLLDDRVNGLYAATAAR